LQTPISISAIASISALGSSPKEVWDSYLIGHPLFSKKQLGVHDVFVSCLSSELEREVLQLRQSNPSYKQLDRVVLLSILAARKVFSSEKVKNRSIGINIGSSRGATQLFEQYYTQFKEKEKISPYASPTTTLGNISSWIGQELGVDGVQIGHSVTCSTALHAVLNGIAWLQAEMAEVFLVGGSEAALTPFTIAQMQALKLYSSSKESLACESMLFDKKKNTMVLGEGAAVAVLEKGISDCTQALVIGYGFASEKLKHNSSISENATCFQKSMKMALQKSGIKIIDAIVMHAPGTVKGDRAEMNAIETVFGINTPLLTSNKWLIGHTFGASGMMSLELAVLMLQHNRFIENPFYKNMLNPPSKLKTVLINAVGFGGNAVSIIISKL